MAIIYDADRFLLLDSFELNDINPGEQVKAFLVAHFRDSVSGKSFMFMVNHLYRSRADQRHLQARLPNEWAQQQAVPVIAVGDYSFDWSVTNGDADHDEGYDLMISGDIFEWIRPEQFVMTHDSSHFNSVLDFVFVSGEARQWTASSDIVVEVDDFPDDSNTPDHRPIRAEFTFSSVDIEGEPQNLENIIRSLIERINRLGQEVKELKERLDSR